MSTATVSTDALQQIGELHQRASELKENYETQYGQIMQEIIDLAAGKKVSSTNEPQRDKPPASGGGAATAKPPAPKRRGRPSTPSSSSKPQSGQRNYDNDMTLKEAAFDVLDREDWKGILEKEDGDVTLSAGEIKKVIESEGKWVSSASDITSQLQGALRDLRKMGLVIWENKKYYVPEGAEYPKS